MVEFHRQEDADSDELKIRLTELVSTLDGMQWTECRQAMLDAGLERNVALEEHNPKFQHSYDYVLYPMIDTFELGLAQHPLPLFVRGTQFWAGREPYPTDENAPDFRDPRRITSPSFREYWTTISDSCAEIKNALHRVAPRIDGCDWGTAKQMLLSEGLTREAQLAHPIALSFNLNVEGGMYPCLVNVSMDGGFQNPEYVQTTSAQELFTRYPRHHIVYSPEMNRLCMAEEKKQKADAPNPFVDNRDRMKGALEGPAASGDDASSRPMGGNPYKSPNL